MAACQARIKSRLQLQHQHRRSRRLFHCYSKLTPSSSPSRSLPCECCCPSKQLTGTVASENRSQARSRGRRGMKLWGRSGQGSCNKSRLMLCRRPGRGPHQNVTIDYTCEPCSHRSSPVSSSSHSRLHTSANCQRRPNRETSSRR